MHDQERKRRSNTNTSVLSRDGRYLGRRHVMYCRETKMYVSGNCLSETHDRNWAWSGTPAQAQRAREMFGIGQEYVLYVDGKEKNIG